MFQDIRAKVDQNNFIKMCALGENEAKNILMSSVMQYNHSVNSRIQDCVLKSVEECTLPLYAKVRNIMKNCSFSSLTLQFKVLAWQTSWWMDTDNDIVPKGNISDQLIQMLEELEHILGAIQVQHALAILTCTKHGIMDSEMIDMLAFDQSFYSTATYGKQFATTKNVDKE